MIEIYKYNETHIFIKCELDDANNINDSFSFYPENYFLKATYKSGLWDGKIKMFDISTGLFPLGLLSDLLRYFKTYKLRYDVKDKELFDKGPKLSHKKIHEFNVNVMKCKMDERDYQLEAVQLALYHKRRLITSATGSGKSYIAFTIFNILRYTEKCENFLLVVPSTNLVDQMSKDFSEYAENFCDYTKFTHKIYSGEQKDTDKPITISTWQSLQNLPAKYFEKFDCVICDEVHGAEAKELSSIIQKCTLAEYKIGMTGSLKDSKVHKMTLKGLFGPLNKVSSARELIDRKILSDLKVRVVILNYPYHIRQLFNKRMREFKKLEKSKYALETEFINERKEKITLIRKILEMETDKNNLILFKTIEYGKRLRDYFKKIYPDKKILYVDGSIKKERREKIRAEAENNNNVIIIASYGTFSVGVNIKRLHNVIFAESYKSSIKIVQSIGRILRKHELKDFAIIYDLADNLSWKTKQNYTMKHLFKRVSIYDSEKHNFSVKEIELK